MTTSTRQWPKRLWLIRHGESAGNVARDDAYAARRPRIELAERDVDVPLSPRGLEQSDAVAQWFSELEDEALPDRILTSPYRRARQTAEILHVRLGVHMPIIVDERLREKEFGILDRLTRWGIEQLHPEQAEIRQDVGKFYHRPPGGESWCDVILRLRSALHTISLEYGDCRVAVVAHQVVVLCFRYLLEHLDESRLLSIDSAGDVANCSITDYVQDAQDGMRLQRYNWTAPLKEAGTPITATPDANEPETQI